MRNIRVIMGDDSFRVANRVSFFAEKFQEKYPEGVIERFGAEDSFEQVKQACYSAGGLFGTKSLIILKEYWTPESYEKAEKSKFFAEIEAQNDLTLLIVQEKIPKNTRYGKFFHTLSIESFLTDKFDLQSWTKEQIKAENVPLSADLVPLLLAKTGNSTGRVHTELQKLKTYAQGAKITKKDLEELVLATPEAAVWDLTAAIRDGNAKKCLELFATLKKMGMSSFQILAAIIFEIEKITKLYACQSAKAAPANLGLNPRGAYFYTKILKQITPETLWWMIESLYRIDKSQKNGEIKTSTNDETELDASIEQVMIEWSKKLKT